MPLGHKKQRKNQTEMDHPQKRHLQKSAAQAEMICSPLMKQRKNKFTENQGGALLCRKSKNWE